MCAEVRPNHCSEAHLNLFGTMVMMVWIVNTQHITYVTGYKTDK